MKKLHLTLKKKWFDMIASGEKKEEYREIKSYWFKRLKAQIGFNAAKNQEHEYWFYPDAMFDKIIFKNGYSKDAPTLMVECKGIEVGKAKPEWSDNWQGEVFIIKLGDILPSITE